MRQVNLRITTLLLPNTVPYIAQPDDIYVATRNDLARLPPIRLMAIRQAVFDRDNGRVIDIDDWSIAGTFRMRADRRLTRSLDALENRLTNIRNHTSWTRRYKMYDTENMNEPVKIAQDWWSGWDAVEGKRFLWWSDNGDLWLAGIHARRELVAAIFQRCDTLSMVSRLQWRTAA